MTVDHAKLRALAEAATPGPWFVDSYRHYADRRAERFRVMYTARDAYNLGAKFSLASLGNLRDRPRE